MPDPAVRTIVGRLLIPLGYSPALTALFRVTVSVEDDDAHEQSARREVPVQPDGFFAIDLPDRRAGTVKLLGPTGEVLDERKLDDSDDAIEISLSADLGTGHRQPLEAPTLIDPVVLGFVRRRVLERVESGELPPDVGDVMGGVEAIVGLLDDLLPDAHRALSGDEAGAHRFRRGLLAIPIMAMPVTAAPPQEPERGSARLWGEFLLTGAVAAIATDEDDHVALFTSLSGALDLALQIDLLASIPSPDVASTRAMMFSMGGFGGFSQGGAGGLDELGRPGRGLKLPGHSGLGRLVGGLKNGLDLVDLSKGPKFYWDPEEHRLVWDPPLYVEPCIIGAIREMSKLRANGPQWWITSMSDAAACPGRSVVLKGSGFGSNGVVFFTGPGATKIAGAVLAWTDWAIQVVVPTDAVPGPISLQVALGTVSFCGGVFALNRQGKSDVTFVGGKPDISYLDLSWKNGPIITPDTDAVVDFGYTAAAGITGKVTVLNAGTQIATFAGLSGGSHQLTFHAPATNRPIVLDINAQASNACGTTTKSLQVTVSIAPKLAIVGMEVIQAVQRPDPLSTGTGLGSTLRLAARKRTAIRVYVTSGLPSNFSYDTSPAAIAVSATAQIFGTTLEPLKPSIALQTATRLTAIEFEIPWPMCVEKAGISVTVRPAAAMPGLSGYSVSRNTSATFAPQSPLQLVRIRVRDDHYGLPAPTTAQWMATIQGPRERFPIAENGIVVFAVVPDEIGTNVDLNTPDGWEDLLDEIDDLAEDAADFGQVWTAMVPSSTAYAWNGLAHSPFDGIFEFDARAMIVQQSSLAGCAHEICHTFGIQHSPGGDPGGKFPKDPDNSLPSVLEPDVIGWRESDDKTFGPGSPDLMSYMTPSSGTREDRWPSGELWNRLFDRLS